LDLLLIRRDELLALADASAPPDLFAQRNVNNPYGVLTDERIPHAARIADVQAHPENIKWYYRLIVIRETKCIVGSISFHAPPDQEGMVEIGFGIASNERGNGYATEALRAMWDWASEQEGVRTLRYTVSPDNAASQAVIAKFPARHMGVQIDDEDGPEDIFEIDVAQYLTIRE
jgi:RimJ/RimL family protein N-acetyltransferase